jgi:hypothetical protein
MAARYPGREVSSSGFITSGPEPRVPAHLSSSCQLNLGVGVTCHAYLIQIEG